MRFYKGFQKRITGTAIALTIAIVSITQPITVYAHESARMATLTKEARDIVLSDFEYLAEILIQNAPFQGSLYRRLGFTLEEHLDITRHLIKSMRPIPSFTVRGLGERWEGELTDDLYKAADYLYSLLAMLGFAVESIGHMGPMRAEEFTRLLTHMEIVGYTLGNDPELASEFDIRLIEWFYDVHGIFTKPASLWLYDVSLEDIDITIDIAETRRGNENNVTTRILEPDRIAYIHIASWANCYELDGEVLFPFFEEVQSYEHLIIDIRGNAGGFPEYVTKVIGALIDEPLDFVYYEFFTAGEMAMGIWDVNTVFLVTADDKLNAYEFIHKNNLTAFNKDDLALITYAVRWNYRIEPMENSSPFMGDIWILVDDRSASASELIALIAMDTGFATVVGEPTRGVTPVQTLHISLPQTGIIFRLDIGSLVDSTGRSLEEFGVTPQIANNEGMDALETVLSVIDKVSARRCRLQLYY